jgi:exopolysaccharide biosynthesis protein
VIARGRDPVPSIYDLGVVDWVWWEMRTAIGGGPTLVHDGKVWITNKEEQMFTEVDKEKTPRTAMGYTLDNRLIILVIQGRSKGIADGATLLQEARILKSLGCHEALNLDGGGSSCMLINGRETITPSDPGGQRPLPAVFIIMQGAGGK